MGVIKDLRGRRFGRLKVPETVEPVVRGGHAYWPVICDCGAHDWVRGTKLRDGSIKSCGCERADPEVRRLARSGPGPEDHYDDALDMLEAFYEPDEPPEERIEPEAYRLRLPCEKSRGVVPESVKRRDLEEGVEPPAEDAGVRPGALQEAPDALDQAIYGTPVVRPAERRQPDGEQPDKANPPDVDWDALDL